MSDKRLPLVAHVITGLEIGGAERMLERIASSSRHFRHEVVTLGLYGPMGDALKRFNVPVHVIGARTRWSGAHATCRLGEILRRLAPNVVQSWLIHANLAAALAKPPSCPLIWSVRHTLQGIEREKALTRVAIRGSALASRRAAFVVYNSHSAAYDHEQIGYPKGKRIVIANGFDIEAARRSKSERQSMRSNLGVSDKDLLIGLIARVHPIKNHEAILDAMQILSQEFPRMRLLLAGKGTEPQGKLAKKYADRLGRQVLWLGEREDIDRVTAALDVGCNVSYGEAFSNTVGEAMAVGVPCLVTDVGESRAIVGDAGWVSRGTDSTSIASALRAIVEMSRDERSEFGRRASRRIARLYSIYGAVDGYEEVYRAAIAGVYPAEPTARD